MSSAPFDLSMRPPRLPAWDAVLGWIALLLAICARRPVAVSDLLRPAGRAGRAVADARRLMVWAFMEVTDLPEQVALSWLEQCTGLSRRTLVNASRGHAPHDLHETLQVYSRLSTELGRDDVLEATAAGLFGRQRRRARAWPRGFLERLGLKSRQEGSGQDSGA